MKTINEQLIDLYGSYWEKLKSQAMTEFENDEIKPACPLLLQVNEDEYSEADIKIMYCGQETRGWGKENLISCDMESVLDIYRNYFFKQTYLKNSKRSAFWKGVKNFDAFFKRRFKDKKIVSVWNNVSKIGKAGEITGVTDKIRALERNYFPVLKREFEILKPDIVIFMTGTRDDDIRHNFKDVKIEQIDSIESTERQLALVSSELIAKVAIRTYHPAYFGGFYGALPDAKRVLEMLIKNKLD
jgi:hypothetical protein